MALYVLRLEEYPRSNAVPEENMRLEFWAWNIIAEENITINPHYEKLELYGTTVFETYGGYNGYFVYFRPMSLTKMLNYSKINSITQIKEYGGTMSIMGYIVQVDAPERKTDKPYIVFRVEAENRENNEKDENIYFYEIINFK
ncbi:hypothetical protein [Treponema sp. R80B11-R83G3]